MLHSIKKIYPSDFPETISEIPQPPKALYIEGAFPDFSKTMLTVIGSRKYTSYGKEVCERLTAGLRGYPIVIVSGLALGIDAIAHRSAINANLPTIAFPGSGLSRKVLYPATNARLADEIVANGGTLISEYEPDFRATAWSFPQRNRLMAGISKATLVIEAEEKSGTLITARLALDYNREVYAVPGSIFSPSSRGTNRLIREGATPITESSELLLALGFSAEKNQAQNDTLFSDCSEDERKIIEILREPMPRDELVRKADLPVQELNALLSLLEIKGLISEQFGEIHRVI
jgi:DNA processing protein